jgi:uncharacterized membrane protein
MTPLNRTDVAELAVGACVLAFPVAVTEEVWNLSEQMPVLNVLLLISSSCIFLSVFVYYIHGRKHGAGRYYFDWKRVLATYGVTLFVCATILIMLGKFPLFSDTATALNRVVLIAFPACFSATVVDSLR